MPQSPAPSISPFASLGSPSKVWAISAIHSQADKLMHLHDQLIGHIRPGDRIVYLGNYTGQGSGAISTIDEILTFRRMVLAMPGMMPQDFSYLRGQQEQMWYKLLELHFSPNPVELLIWMLGNGMRETLENYGFSPHDGIDYAKESVVALARWISKIQDAVRHQPGHMAFHMQLRRAAFTQNQSQHPLLFVHAGIDPRSPLQSQGEALWWPSFPFNNITEAYSPFQRVVRGFDPHHKGVHINCVTATIDGGCGYDGQLIAAGFNPDGEVTELFEA